jgi:HEPN domain-containing protein
MNVNIDNKSVLFFKAYEDIWAAERTVVGSPNIAVWHCAQAVEKILKGFLHCCNLLYDSSHELEPLLEDVISVTALSDECKANVLNLSIYKSGLRYKNMTNDPSPEDAKIVISRTKIIMQEFSENPRISQFIDEAREVHTKTLRLNLEKYGDK